MSQLRIWLLGPPLLELDGEPVHIGRRKATALLAYLVVTAGKHSRASLATLFWPEYDQTRARSDLRRTLSVLNKTLGAGWLSADREIAGLSEAAEVWLDVDEFHRLIAAWETHGHPVMETCEECLPLLRVAVELYRDDFLAGFSLRDSLNFDEWQFFQTESLRQELAATLERLVRGHADQEAYDLALPYARRWLALDPLHEPAHRWLMQLYAQAGQWSAAARQYHVCVRTLQDELGIEPSLKTTQLYQQIKADQVFKHQHGTPATIQKVKLPPHNLPAHTTPFVGRHSELTTLDQFLANSAVRLITILGPGGIGKTRLALNSAASQLEQTPEQQRFPHGVYFVSLARLESSELLVPKVAETIGFDFVAGSDFQGQLLRYLRHKKMLLILDNFEHLLDATFVIDDILQRASEITILVTSRTKLNRSAEHLFPIEGLAFPHAETALAENLLTQFSSYSALRLFRQCARRTQKDFALTTTNLPAVSTICRLVDGMPLGIILAASWLDTLSPQEIAREIQRDLDFLTTEMGDMPRRQRSLRAAFNHSWRLLTDREQEILLQFSVFRGGFTRAAAESIAGAQLRDLQALVNKSLLTLLPGSRYEIHELLRQFAAERLAKSSRKESVVRERHSFYYCNLLHQHTENWHTAQQLKTLAQVTIESDNIQKAWQWAVEHKEWGRLRAAMDSWGWYHDWRGRFPDGESLCQAVIQKIEGEQAEVGTASTDGLRLWAKALAWQGKFSMTHQIALRRLRQSLALLQRAELNNRDTRFEQAFVHLGIGKELSALDRQRARQHIKQCLTLFQELDSAWGIAAGLTELGDLDWATGDYPSSLAVTQGSLTMHQERGDRRAQLACISILAWDHLHLGNLDEAERLRREAIALSHQLKERSSLIALLARMAVTLFWQGKFTEGLEWAEKSLKLCLEDGRRDKEGYVQIIIAGLLLFSGQYERARLELGRSLIKVRETDARGVEATVHWILSCLALAEGAYDDAKNAIEESLRLYEEVQDNYVGFALSGLGYVTCLKNELPLARNHFIKLLAYARQRRDAIFLMQALPGVALYLARTNRRERAIELWSQARRQPFVANSQWYEDVVGHELEDLVLPPDIIDQARKRGQSKDIWATVEQLLAEL